MGSMRPRPPAPSSSTKTGEGPRQASQVRPAAPLKVAVGHDRRGRARSSGLESRPGPRHAPRVIRWIWIVSPRARLGTNSGRSRDHKFTCAGYAIRPPHIGVGGQVDRIGAGERSVLCGLLRPPRFQRDCQTARDAGDAARPVLAERNQSTAQPLGSGCQLAVRSSLFSRMTIVFGRIDAKEIHSAALPPPPTSQH